MSKHHHKPHEGHSDGKHHSTSSRKPIHHDWRFYAAGLLIFIALLLFLLSGDLTWQPRLPAPEAPSSNVR